MEANMKPVLCFPAKKKTKKRIVMRRRNLDQCKYGNKQERPEADRIHKDDLIAVVSFLFLFIFAKVSIVL